MSIPLNAALSPYPQRFELMRDTLMAQPTQSRYEAGNRVIYPRVVSPGTVLPAIEANDELILWLNEAGRLWKRSGNTESLYHSDDGGGSWTLIDTFEDKSVGPLRDLPNGEVIIGLSPATDPAELWLSSGYQSGSPTWTKVLTFDTRIVSSTQRVLLIEPGFSKVYDNIVCVTEYDSGDGTRSGKKVWMSMDYGRTFAVVYDQSADPDQNNGNAHIHGVAYDPWWQRIWIAKGDATTGTTNNLVVYSDDFGETWQTMPDIGEQFVAVWPTKDCIFFGTDSLPNGVYRVWRENKDLPKFEFAYQCQPADDLGLSLQSLTAFQRGDAYPVFLSFIHAAGRGMTQIISTADGVNFSEIYHEPLPADPDDPETDYPQFGSIYGPTDQGQSFAQLVRNSTNYRATFSSIDIVDSYRPLTDHRLVRHSRFRDPHKGSIRSAYIEGTDDNNGDHEIVVLVNLDDWFNTDYQTIWARFASAFSEDLSILLAKNTSSAGQLVLSWKENTMSSTSREAATSSRLPIQSGRPLWVKVALDTDNGSGQYQVRWYTSNADPWTSIDDVTDWTLLDTVTGSTGTTSVKTTASPMEIGAFNGEGDNTQMVGRVYCLEVRKFVDGEALPYASVDFREEAWRLEPRTAYSSQSNFDRTGRLWSLTAGEIWADIYPPAKPYLTDRTNPTTVAAVPTGKQFDAATTTTLANVTGLSRNVEAGITYRFKASLDAAPSSAGGHKYAIGGTATATTVYYWVKSRSTSADVISSRQSSLGGAAGESSSGATSAQTTIEGTIVVSTAGTLTVQFAQQASSGTSSVLSGSTFEVTEIG